MASTYVHIQWMKQLPSGMEKLMAVSDSHWNLLHSGLFWSSYNAGPHIFENMYIRYSNEVMIEWIAVNDFALKMQSRNSCFWRHTREFGPSSLQSNVNWSVIFKHFSLHLTWKNSISFQKRLSATTGRRAEFRARQPLHLHLSGIMIYDTCSQLRGNHSDMRSIGHHWL